MDARIVIIDNDQGMRDLFTLALKKQGCQVSSYSYAEINLAALTHLSPNLIILDFNFRDYGLGWEFLQMLKMAEATANIPILITTTAFLLSAEVRAYLSARYINVMHKPFDIPVFLTLVQQTLTQASQAGVLFSSDLALPILLVDDNQDLSETFSTVLMLEGYQVVTANNGQVALDTVSHSDYCLILLDIAMPIMNGFEFLAAYDRQLRPHIPVIIISAETDMETHVLPSFVVDVLTKPFEISRLVKLVGKYAQPVQE